MPKDSYRSPKKKNIVLEMLTDIKVRGAREHNLRGVNVDIPRPRSGDTQTMPEFQSYVRSLRQRLSEIS